MYKILFYFAILGYKKSTLRPDSLKQYHYKTYLVPQSEFWCYVRKKKPKLKAPESVVFVFPSFKRHMKPSSDVAATKAVWRNNLSPPRWRGVLSRLSVSIQNIRRSYLAVVTVSQTFVLRLTAEKSGAWRESGLMKNWSIRQQLKDVFVETFFFF